MAEDTCSEADKREVLGNASAVGGTTASSGGGGGAPGRAQVQADLGPPCPPVPLTYCTAFSHSSSYLLQDTLKKAVGDIECLVNAVGGIGCLVMKMSGMEGSRTTIPLRNGVLLPRVGLGTFKVAGGDVHTAVTAALDAGLRHIDTASIYKNEALIAEALKDYKIERSEVFITSKVSPYEMGALKSKEACSQILQRLNTDYVDLVLVHWPGASKVPVDSEPKSSAADRAGAGTRMSGAGAESNWTREGAETDETWHMLEQLYEQGSVRAIGVSNYEVNHMKELLDSASILPMFELHPRKQCKE
eukprot:gene2779-12656_t